jgi:hypothetical protein
MTQYIEEISVSGETFIRRIDEDGANWCIPISTTNSDYQRYLRWLENPNEAEQSTPSFTSGD